MTLSYTKNLHLAVPDFLTEPWHGEFAQAMDSIDRILFSAVVAANATMWANGTLYEVGDLVIDPATGGIFSRTNVDPGALSSPPPTTFTQEQIAHPDWWTPFAPTLATQAEAEAGTDNIKYMSPLRVAQAIDAQAQNAGIASQAEAEAGTNNTQMMTPLRVSQSIAVRVAAVPQGRLTLLHNQPIPITSMIGTQTLYYAPLLGTAFPIYDGTSFNVHDLAGEIPANVLDTTHSPALVIASGVYDWFIWEDDDVVTISIGSPAVVALAGHGFAANQPIRFTTTGTLPLPLVPDKTYYVGTSLLTSNDFIITETPDAPSAITTVGSQTGTHTLHTNRLTHGPIWASDSARSIGTELARVKGLWINAAAISNGPAQFRGTYVGTTKCDNSGPTLTHRFGSRLVGGGEAFLGVWNAYNRQRVITTVQDATGSWTTGNVWPGVSPLNFSLANRISAVCGLSEDPFSVEFSILTSTGGPNVTYAMFAYDNTVGAVHPGIGSPFAVPPGAVGSGTLNFIPNGGGDLNRTMLKGISFPLGFHFFQANQTMSGFGSAGTMFGNYMDFTLDWRN